MEILSPGQYKEYEAFVSGHPAGSITQSTLWHGVKPNWTPEVVVSRDSGGRIVGGISVLVQRIPLFRVSMLYAPRGPVCDLHDRAVLEDLKSGVDALAKKHRAYLFKMDPDISMEDKPFLETMKGMGFRLFNGPTGFETVQTRFNYRLYLEGRDEEALFANLTQKTRYNVRVARKHQVEIRVMGEEALDDFMRIMRTTGDRDGFNIRPKSYFAKMLEALGGHVRLYMAYYQGEAVSGAVTTNYAGKTCYVYGASDNAHRNVMPNYLIQWEMIRWAVETGCTVYDFQGVSGVVDEKDHLYGLYRFKKGFNGVVDELPGEFDFVYYPIREKLVNLAMAVYRKLRPLRKRLFHS